ERPDALLLILELEPDRHALFLAGHSRRVALAGQVVDVFHRTGWEIDLALDDLELRAPGEVDDVLTLRPDMPVAEITGLTDSLFCARHFFEHRLRAQRDVFDVREAVGAGVDPFDDGRSIVPLGLHHVSTNPRTPRQQTRDGENGRQHPLRDSHAVL